MKLNSYCMNCLVNRQMEKIQDYDDEDIKSEYMKKILRIISNANEDESAPLLIEKINKLHKEYFGTSYSFDDLKYQYNDFMLQREESIWEKIQEADDRMLQAIKYARIGSYIDFGGMGSIDDVKLDNLLDKVDSENIEITQYNTLINDLQYARHLVYITDNCGEIVLDKLLIRYIKQEYPSIHITVIVRGTAILNDATIEDARMVGLTEFADIIGNGTGIAGTCLDSIDNNAKVCIEAADVIISKGHGNFETLNGCGLNIYYAFLCKCEWFVKRFGVKQFEGVFMNERYCLS